MGNHHYAEATYEKISANTAVTIIQKMLRDKPIYKIDNSRSVGYRELHLRDWTDGIYNKPIYNEVIFSDIPIGTRVGGWDEEGTMHTCFMLFNVYDLILKRRLEAGANSSAPHYSRESIEGLISTHVNGRCCNCFDTPEQMGFVLGELDKIEMELKVGSIGKLQSMGFLQGLGSSGGPVL